MIVEIKWIRIKHQMIITKNSRRVIKIKYIECKTYKKQILRNKTKKCNRYKNKMTNRAQERRNQEDGDNEMNILRE